MRYRLTIKTLCALFLIFSIASSFTHFKDKEQTAYKCMVHLTNYEGEGAYVVVSLINPKGEYEKTLYVLGDDEEWYFDIDEWWKFQGKVRADISAITGATISGGERSIFVLNIDNEKVNQGYKLRFETAVEDQEYYTKDVQFELTDDSAKGKYEGSGFIRYVRMMPQ